MNNTHPYDEMEVVQEFISCYKHYKALWDNSSVDYLSKKMKEPGYLELLKILRHVNPDANVNDVKRKINSLRCCYRRELKKIQSSFDGYETRLWWFHKMDFLKPVLNIESPRQGQHKQEEAEEEEPLDSYDDEDDDNDDGGDNDEELRSTQDDDIFAEPFSVEEDVLELDGDIEHVEESSPSVRVKSELKSENQTTIDYIQSPEPEAEPSTAETSRQSGKERRRRHSSADESVSDVLQQKKRRLNLHNAQKIDNECDIIGKRMAVHFRNMRMDQRLFAERIISEVLIFGRMNRLSLDARFLPNGSS
ncbi:uncharacterized protein LOC115629943 isoform X2 [Scaptodrosophila lebanonensis]|uniref:Uncharacterized protein LOC115629943 isoform X2 n=1 Tax=Drosophila lebanonensis TaxID=7225 RepID=A0A6J2U4J1_DROLE|nr:uncharacterized protein LOC115629943 isoform X2 [Scaptodrosophila lebanonensis]